VPQSFGAPGEQGKIRSGIESLDAMLHGGIERGSVTLITGPTGAGKTTLATQFLSCAAQEGERGVVYSFEESKAVILRRCGSIGMPAAELCERGDLAIVEIEPLDYTPDQFALAVREEVEQRGAKLIVLDSLSGYRLAIRGENLVEHIHSLCRYLRNMGVTVIVLYEISTVTGEFRATEAGLSYLADNIVFLRYVEIDSELRRVIGVLKKRTSDFEKKLREIRITSRGLEIGEPLTGFRGILLGVAARDEGSLLDT
jgi:circadian clock protein KaiC